MPKKSKEIKDYFDDLLGKLSTYKTDNSQDFRGVSI